MKIIGPCRHDPSKMCQNWDGRMETVEKMDRERERCILNPETCGMTIKGTPSKKLGEPKMKKKVERDDDRFSQSHFSL